jgi:hypothetical protein
MTFSFLCGGNRVEDSPAGANINIRKLWTGRIHGQNVPAAAFIKDAQRQVKSSHSK